MRFLLFFFMAASLSASPVFTLMIQEQNEETQDKIINFWFGKNAGPISTDQNDIKKWFVKDPDFDQEIREKFELDIHRASSGRYDTWEKTPKGRLALILLLDQFKRNIYRNSPKAWESDEKAQEIALEGVRLGDDKKLSPLQRLFFYMPLEHSENRNLQVLSVGCFSDLVAQIPEEKSSLYKSFVDYAIRHKEIIDRFGRYPHRNKILGRKSTTQEIEFLKEPNSSF